MNPTVRLGESFDDLWSGDDVVIDERRTDRAACHVPDSRGRVCSKPFGHYDECAPRRADGELVGQLRLPDEFLPVPAGEMFP